ncbi:MULTISPECIES: hypothetical protein [unclassified Paenibacillus]|uniref:hypothetical protein n=1 Tax=unclassified Paenibacillus TaxID=185978 RepID=UPI001AEA8CBB|nr:MULTISPECIES: hypothetical protein [unclassified Paenibacillus]MBP1154547.1 Na+/H+ antiporter NhaC [Paenibacillus sp. PvP091]MBP1170069.1 Na+/H+ antiporter NhaC [Paenibacillus sp. PvR098]MBP2441097.1 Na+/H+ antiporter NhaC [Paenibacillus sp. PvP052]
MIYYILIILIGIIAAVATFIVGNSQQNREEGGNYGKQTKGNILRLSYLNIISTVIWVVVLLFYLFG